MIVRSESEIPTNLTNIDVVVRHSQDPVFEAIRLTDGTFRFGIDPAIWLLFGLSMILASVFCALCTGRSCIQIQIKEAARIREMRQKQYEMDCAEIEIEVKKGQTEEEQYEQIVDDSQNY